MAAPDDVNVLRYLIALGVTNKEGDQYRCNRIKNHDGSEVYELVADMIRLPNGQGIANITWTLNKTPTGKTFGKRKPHLGAHKEP